MSIPAQNAQALMEKIQSLPTDRIAEVEDFVDFLKQQARLRKAEPTSKEPLDFPVMSVGKWPSDFSLSREGMYGDDGR